jgi:cation transport ATPase
MVRPGRPSISPVVETIVTDGIEELAPGRSYHFARESADVVLMEHSLWRLVKAVEISRGAVGLIRQNYAIVAGLNTLALGRVLPGGLISPEITALISNGSAIVATRNGISPILRYQ